MKNLTFKCSKVSEAISETKAFQCQLSTGEKASFDELCGKVAAELGIAVATVKSVLSQTNAECAKFLGQGTRVTLDGFVRFEPNGKGSFATEDEQWNPEKHSLIVSVIPYDNIKYAASGLIPENVMKPVAVQLLGAQDATTFAQNEVVKGHTLLCQGKYLNTRQENTDEGLFVVDADGNSHRLTITQSTVDTIDATVPSSVPAGDYRLEVRSRGGESTDRMLVTASIAHLEIKEA